MMHEKLNVLWMGIATWEFDFLPPGLIAIQILPSMQYKASFSNIKSVFDIAVAVMIVIWKKLFYKKYF